MFHITWDKMLRAPEGVQEKLEIMIQLANDRNIDQVLLEFKEYATEVDVEFVRKVLFILPSLIVVSWSR